MPERHAHHCEMRKCEDIPEASRDAQNQIHYQKQEFRHFFQKVK
jgi:hypothetical protein